jgi:hypothetical protein
MQGRRSESVFQATIGVRGQLSDDETSESGSYLPSEDTSLTSSTPSLFSTGSFHHHAVRPAFTLPDCPTCRRPLQFGLYHSDNHTCDAFLCSSSVMPTGSWGWHCAHCSIDLCCVCFPIDWDPISSISTLNSFLPDSFPSQNSFPPSQNQAPAPLSDGTEAAA